MDWQQAYRARLLAASPLAAQVFERIYWGERPQGSSLPAVTLMLVGDARNQHLKGFDSIQPARVQVDVWGATYAAARGVISLVLDAIVPGARVNGHVFARAVIDIPPRDLIERVSTGANSETRLFRVSMDLIVNHAPEDAQS